MSRLTNGFWRTAAAFGVAVLLIVPTIGVIKMTDWALFTGNNWGFVGAGTLLFVTIWALSFLFGSPDSAEGNGR